MKRIDIRDVISGVSLLVFGLFAALYATIYYPIGTLQHMGPGFFPVALGYILAGLGLIMILSTLRKPIFVPEAQLKFASRAFIAVVAALSTFALSVRFLGLVPATLALTFVAAFAEHRVRPVRALLLGSFLALAALLIFRIGLGLPIPAFRHW